MDEDILKSKFTFYFDYSSVLNGPIKTELDDDSSVIAMQKYQEGIRDHPSLEIRLFYRDSDTRQELSNPRLQCQNGKAE